MCSNSFTNRVINDNTYLIETGARIDNNNVIDFMKTITGAQESKYRYIILDFAKLEFISSAGVGAFLSRLEISRDMEGDLIFCNLSEDIKFILSELDVTDYLTITSNREEAESISCAHG